MLGVPVVVTEQYPRGLGPTVAELDEVLQGAERLEKVTFSAAAAPGWDALLDRLGRRQVLLCGIEAHVCVHQTATELLRAGLEVHAALDAIESREAVSRQLGVDRMLADGVVAQRRRARPVRAPAHEGARRLQGRAGAREGAAGLRRRARGRGRLMLGDWASVLVYLLFAALIPAGLLFALHRRRA